MRLIPTAALFALLATFPALAPAAESVDEFLSNFEAKTRKLKSYEIVTETTTNSAYGVTIAKCTTVSKRSGETVKYSATTETSTTGQYVQGEQKASLKVISDGKIMWTESVSLGQTSVAKAKAPTDQTGYETIRDYIKKGAKGSVLGPQEVNGEDCGVIQFVVGEGNATYTYTYWLNAKTGLLAKLEGKSALYGTMETIVLSVKVDGAVEDSLFVYTPPANAQIFDSTTTSAAPPIGSK